jgi:hypothetical protein
MDEYFVWANVRMASMSVGRVTYGTKVYKDYHKGFSKNVVLKGTRMRRDKVMLDAFRDGANVLVTIHAGKGDLLPKLFGHGRIVKVTEGPEGFREFDVELEHRFPYAPHKRGKKTTEDAAHCWIKRAFLREMGLTATGNLMAFAVKCRFAPEDVDERTL